MGKLNESSITETQDDFENYDPRDDQILELSNTCSDLFDENKLLRDGIMARIKPNPEDGSISFGDIMKALETEIKFLRDSIRVLTIRRDHFMNEVAERERAAIYWKKRAKRVERQLEGVMKNA